MKNIKDKEKHLKRYIGLVVTFFILEFLLQTIVLVNDWDLSMGGFIVPRIVNYEALFISIAMIFMGFYYIKK